MGSSILIRDFSRSFNVVNGDTKSLALYSFRNRKGGDVDINRMNKKEKKDMDEKEENICIHTRRRSARIQVRTSPPVASCSSGRQTDADPIKIVPPCHIPRYCCRTSVYIASRTSSSELFCFFSPSPVLSSRKIGSLLYIYTNRGKRFSKEIV
jgi:hypothetical protein